MLRKKNPKADFYDYSLTQKSAIGRMQEAVGNPAYRQLLTAYFFSNFLLKSLASRPY
jgi:hypothetical protein